jgi:hypothetical protein
MMKNNYELSFIGTGSELFEYDTGKINNNITYVEHLIGKVFLIT